MKNYAKRGDITSIISNLFVVLSVIIGRLSINNKINNLELNLSQVISSQVSSEYVGGNKIGLQMDELNNLIEAINNSNSDYVSKEDFNKLISWLGEYDAALDDYIDGIQEQIDALSDFVKEYNSLQDRQIVSNHEIISGALELIHLYHRR